MPTLAQMLLLLALAPAAGSPATSVSMAAPSLLVVDSNASAVERYAASTLSEHLAVAIGRPVPVLSIEEARANASTGTQVWLCVGYRAAVELGRVAASQLDALGHADDAFVTAARAGIIALAAPPSSARGTANAAFDFLRSCGFRFLAPGVTVPPQRPLRRINVTSGMTADPPFTLRDTTEVEGMLWTAWGSDRPAQIKRAAVMDSFSQAVGLNGRFAHGSVQGETVGPAYRVTMKSGNTSDGYAHTAFELLSPTGSAQDCGLVGDAAQTSPCPSLVREHPEWFACRSNQGDDVPLLNPLTPNFTSVTYPCTPQLAAQEYSSHLCWSLPAVHLALEAGVRRVLAAAPSSQYVAVEIMDGFSIPCPADMAAVAEGGSFASPVLGAVSAVAAALEQDHPHVKIVTIAYHREATLLPPTRGYLVTDGLHRNVVVEFCMSYELNSASVRSPVNNQTLAQLRAWRQITHSDGLWVWHYMGNIGFPIAPYPYYAALADDIATLAAEGVSGYFGQSASEGGEETALWGGICIYHKRSTYQDRLGTN